MMTIRWKSGIALTGLILSLARAEGAQFTPENPAPMREEPLMAEEAATLGDLPLGLTLRGNERATEIAMTRLRPGDHVIVGANVVSLVAQLPKGLIRVLFVPSKDMSVMKTPEWQSALQAADMFSMDDTKDVEAAKTLRAAADQYGKKVLLAPTGEVTDKVGKEMAPYGDEYLLQAQRWLQEDTSRELTAFCDKVHQLVGEIHKSNPKAVIWVQVGRKLERSGGTAGLFIHAYARLKATHPEDIQMMHPFIGGGDNPPPGHGFAALEQFLDALRPKQNTDAATKPAPRG